MADIQGKVVVITGASSGIGESTARELARQGAHVVMGARRVERLEAVAKDIEQSGGKALAVACDVTKRQDPPRLVEAARKAFGKVDVLVNNAGVMPLSPMTALRVEEWEQTVDVNIKGVLYGIAAALPLFMEQGFGHFINLSSVAGIRTLPNAAVYCGSKFAVGAITDCLRQEMAQTGIRTTVILPGAVESELADTVKHPGAAEAIKGLLEVAIPAQSIADAIAFAIGQPSNVGVHEIVVRPTVQAV